MSTLAVQFLDQGFHRVLFNAMPMPVFVVDQDVTILEYNTAAAQILARDESQILQHRGGEVLKCTHATETPGGCGRAPACLECVLRNSVKAAFEGRSVKRQWSRMELLTGKRRTKVDLRVSCQPITYNHHSFALLILEGLND